MNRIIQICGTSGAGKSTVMRAFIRQTGAVPEFVEGRSQPLGYCGDNFFVVGAYEALSSGGCDTFGGDGRVQRLYALIKERHVNSHVLYEGIMMMNHTRGLQLWRDTKALVVLRLDVSMEDCLASVRERRVAAGKVAEFNEKNTRDSFKRCNAYVRKLRAVGCSVINVKREEALGVLVAQLKGD